MQRARRIVATGALALSLIGGASGCRTIGTAGRTAGEAAGETAEKAGDAAGSAARGAGRVIGNTAGAAEREIHHDDD